MEIDNRLLKEISEYCKLNDLEENTFINHLLKTAFMKEKYGERPCVVAPPSIMEDNNIERTVIKAEEVVAESILEKENPTDVEIIKPKKKSKKIESL